MNDFMAIFYKVLSFAWLFVGTAIILWLLNHVIIGY